MFQIQQPVIAVQKIRSASHKEVPEGTIGTIDTIGHRPGSNVEYYGALFYVYPGCRCAVSDLTEEKINCLCPFRGHDQRIDPAPGRCQVGQSIPSACPVFVYGNGSSGQAEPTARSLVVACDLSGHVHRDHLAVCVWQLLQDVLGGLVNRVVVGGGA